MSEVRNIVRLANRLRWILGGMVSARVMAAIGCPLYAVLRGSGLEGKFDLLKVKSILVVRLDEIGDVVMTTPFLRELRRNLPDAWITLVVKPSIYNLVEICPYVNEVLTYDWSTPRLLRLFQRHWRALGLAAERLWRRRFDVAILPRWDTDYYHGTFVTYLSGARWRVGYSEKVTAYKGEHNKGYDSLLTHVLEDKAVKHEVMHNLDVVRFFGGEVLDDRLELWVDEQDEAFTREVLGGHGVQPSDCLIGLGLGAGASKRQWPIESYRELCSWLHQQYGARFLLIGGRGEEALGAKLEAMLGFEVLNLIGQTTLRQLASLLKRAALFVGNDAGPMHIASAVGIPVVELSCHQRSGTSYSANSPVRFGPWGNKNTVLQPDVSLPGCQGECVSNEAHCILGISVDRVIQAAAEMLSTLAASPGSRPVLDTDQKSVKCAVRGG